MDTFQAKNLALSLMDEHGLLNAGWNFKWSKAKYALGTCIHSYKIIKLSIVYAADTTEENVKDTILHEIAHALIGSFHGHDNTWKAKCIEIGANPVRSSKSYNVPQGKYVITCPVHGILGYYYRRIDETAKRRCKLCSSIVEIKLNENVLV